MTNKAIEIEEMRISSNGNDFEFIINAPDDYLFTVFNITVNGKTFSIADSLFKDGDKYIKNEDNRFIGRVPVSLFEVSTPEIYQVHLEAVQYVIGDFVLPIDYLATSGYTVTSDGFVKNSLGFIEPSSEARLKSDIRYGYIDDVDIPLGRRSFYRYSNSKKSAESILTVEECKNLTIKQSLYNDNEDYFGYYTVYSILGDDDKVKADPVCIPISDDDTIEADALISDVSHVYNCLMDDILSFDANCGNKEVQDRVIRNYLILYAHQEAMHLGYFEEASKWFDLMDNCFTGRCKGNGDRNVKGGCGCKTVRHIERPIKPDFYANCGCRK